MQERSREGRRLRQERDPRGAPPLRYVDEVRAAGALIVALAVAAAGCDVKRVETSDASTTTATATSTTASALPPGPRGEQVIAAGERPLGIAIDPGSVYWSTRWDRQGIRRLSRTSPPGTKPADVCTFTDKSASPDALVVTDTHVYVLTSSPSPGGVYRAPKTVTGATCEKIVDLDFFHGRSATHIGQTVYAVGGGDGTKVVAIDPSGKPTTIAEMAKGADSITTDGTKLYVAEAWSGKLWTIEPTPSSTAAKPVEIGVAGKHLRFAEGQLFYFGPSGSAYALPTTGGREGRVVAHGGVTGGFVVVNGSIYTGYRLGSKGSGWLGKGPTAKDGLVDHGSFAGYVVDVAGDAKDIYVATMQNVVRIPP